MCNNQSGIISYFAKEFVIIGLDQKYLILFCIAEIEWLVLLHTTVFAGSTKQNKKQDKTFEVL
jgi:hypothetical protein